MYHLNVLVIRKQPVVYDHSTDHVANNSTCISIRLRIAHLSIPPSIFQSILPLSFLHFTILLYSFVFLFYFLDISLILFFPFLSFPFLFPFLFLSICLLVALSEYYISMYIFILFFFQRKIFLQIFVFNDMHCFVNRNKSCTNIFNDY